MEGERDRVGKEKGASVEGVEVGGKGREGWITPTQPTEKRQANGLKKQARSANEEGGEPCKRTRVS